MRHTAFWRAGLLTAVAFGGVLGVPTAQPGLFGVGPAEAKAYYTKKRVKGRWITGHFTKRSGRSQRVARRHRHEAEAERGAGMSPSAQERAVSTKRSGSLEAAAAPAHAAPVSIPVQAPLVSAPEAERLGNLRQALQARASALTTGSIVEGARPTAEPQSVSLDFRSGLKTTLFSDGTMVTEPFDTAALKGLAAPPSARR